MLTEIMFVFRKFEGYIPSSIGARSVPVSRLAGWQMKMLNSLVDKLVSHGHTSLRHGALLLSV